MDADTAEKLSQMPEEMIRFTLDAAIQRSGPRLGRLALKNRTPIQTPNYVATTSRGVVPHLTQDSIERHSNIKSLYFGLEDFIEKQPPKIPPIYTIPVAEDGSRLRTFTAHTQDSLLVLGPRRYPPVETPMGGANKKIAISTSFGFASLNVEDYLSAAETLRPDICLAPADIVQHKPSQKRVEKMGDRTSIWLRDAVAYKAVAADNGSPYALFAAVLPVEKEMQHWYLQELVDDYLKGVDGLYVHDAQSVVDLPVQLVSLPRLAFTQPVGPSQLLHQISLGVDLFALPLVSSATDAGIALTFSFPPAENNMDNTERKEIGISMWEASNATDTAPFVEGCGCYACRKHHRAFLHHLLNAKEMLAWVLLQIHNHHVMDQFFLAVRSSIADGTFEQKQAAFDKVYEPELPATGGLGPRVRGYQGKSIGNGEPKKNPKAFNKLDDMAEALAEAEVPSPQVEAEELEDHGLGKKQ